MKGRKGALVSALVVVLAMGGACDRRPELLSDIAVEEVLADLGPSLDAQATREVIRTARRAPGRWAYPTPAARWLETRVAVPSEASLVVEFGVGTDSHPLHGRPVRFRVVIDGVEAFAKTLDPSNQRLDQRWQHACIDLTSYAGREIQVRLGATTVGIGDPVGTPAWTLVQLTRVHRQVRQHSAPDTPNVLLVLVDTLRADVLGCYGADPSPSPVLDGFAREGMRFADVVAAAPWTLPSVTTIFTGHYPREHGVTMADDPLPADHAASYLPTTVPTLATLAQLAGLTTLGISANPLIGPDAGLATGFEYFEDLPASDPVRRWASGNEVNSRFVAWAKSHRDVRFFGYLHYMEPHSPYIGAGAAGASSEMSPDVLAGESSRIARRMLAGGPAPTVAEVAYLRSLYIGAISNWDAMFADLLNALGGLGLRDRTIIVVTADHGEEFLEHGHLAHGKQLFNESLHVPLVVVGPGVPQGTRSEQVQLVDLLPTIAALLGAVAPRTLAGWDMFAPSASALPSRPAFAEVRRGSGFPGPRYLAMVRQPPWKLVWSPDSGHAALFNLVDDPGERRDRGASEEVASGLLASIGQYWSRGVLSHPVGAIPGLGEKLRDLGYAE